MIYSASRKLGVVPHAAAYCWPNNPCPTLCKLFFERLKQVGYADVCKHNPEKATNLMRKHLWPFKLCRVMTERIKFDEPLKKNVKDFVKVISKEATACQTYALETIADGSKHSSSIPSESIASTASGKRNTFDKKPKVPECQYQLHSEKRLGHFIHNYRDCPENQKDRYITQDKAKKGVERNKE